MNKNEDYLRLLSVFHYVVGGMVILFACFPIIHLSIGLLMIFKPAFMEIKPNEAPFTMMMGIIFTLFALVFILGGWALGGCMIATGKYLSRKTRYTFCMVVAGIECIFMPFGTVLGVLTLILILKEDVKALFE